jgi:hypothetical protein
MKIRLLGIVCIALSTLVFSSCGGSSNDEESILFDSLVNTNKTAKVPPEVLQKILKSLPSPVEMTSIIHQSKAKFNKDLLNPRENFSDYTSSYKKAVNLGIYGTDLGYMNIYEETILSMTYLDAIKSLANDLKIGHFFNMDVIGRMVSNKNNIDSLMYISTSSFDKMSTYLNDQNRAHISSLILLGGWIEGLYLYTQTAKAYPTQQLKDRICEQKIALNDIMVLLSVYENNPTFKELITDITTIKKLYDNVTISYKPGEPKVEIVDGMLQIIDSTESVIEISDETYNSLISEVAIIRNKLIQK